MYINTLIHNMHIRPHIAMSWIAMEYSSFL